MFSCNCSLLTTIISFILIINVIVLIDGKPCRYWCKTQKNSFYCCPEGQPIDDQVEDNEFESWPNSPVFFVAILKSFGWNVPFHVNKKIINKKCPPLRHYCPRSFFWSDPPELCEHDNNCDTNSKCCYDICLEDKVCKPSE
ncbi:Protein of unknown function [Cotesia congregata]|uniref:WAP domain-containing protein n=1 Tax=Cotesia congregata TaxID=51543 RepID=A0A8J2HCL1_COTCN|nr:Protein of unknown function [Cotesia congregata]